MNRHVLTVNLKDDPAAIAAYRRHHAHVWPEVVESLRRAGIRDMNIHLLGRRLVMIVELDDGLDLDRAFATHRAANARVAEWEALMRTLQEPVDAAAPGQWWAIMEPVFRLNDERSVTVPVRTPQVASLNSQDQ
jgi:L-rhamnose mutarotase